MSPDNCRDILIRLAPEFADGRLECITYREELGPVRPGTLAYVPPPSRVAIRSELQRLGRWRGTFPATIVFLAPPTLELGLHEAAHALPLGEPRVDPFPAEAPAFEDHQRRLQNERLERPLAVEPWSGGHDAAWLRRVCHLTYRAGELGLQPRLADIHACGELAHDLSDYLAALGWEPRRCSRWPFEAIENEPASECFTKLFHADRATWLERHPSLPME